MIDNRKVIPTMVAVMALLMIGFVFIQGILKTKPKEQINSLNSQTGVLGESTEISPTSPFSFNVNNIIQNTLEETKSVVSEKVEETKNNIISNVQKEITSFSQTQAQNIKMQICKDWGFYSLPLTPSPYP